ncbi:rhomboid family intramembrane serine protease [Acinetobacter qingfengensis]|uniref:Rhomboid family intramembrane serine protease n=1 Tax=Acinetobacter qingfengensis TaxID=1262585 RepID=A0A1E7RDX8_9GAMM|nr:rhomboid family intramembrane serine protease [Acinetobacter qingfengensis]KAA8734373.1 rhomboid family intramembrane serine protease [Acinetobacter qingfengensis]OEY97619.1 rhomboid family intramembrane serine protease [Acinetobacter qingfengensis]
MFNLPINHTISLIIITVVVSLVAFSQPRVMGRLIFWSPAIRQGQIDRFITYGFVHADGFHLLFNMITLFFFGSFIEQFYRQYAFNMGFALFYLGALIVSILPSYLQHRDDPQWMSLGASGAVSAVLFAFILFQPWNLIFVFFIPVPAIIFAILYIAYSIWAARRGNTAINHSAHLWGAAYGILCTILLEPRIISVFLYRLSHPNFLN